MSILDYYRRTTQLGDLNVRDKTLAGVNNILTPKSTRSANNLLGVMPEEKGISIGLLDAAPTVEELTQRATGLTSPQALIPEVKAVAPQRGILSGLLTGEGTSDRLRGLAAGLLTGAQATPVSFGQSLVKGLLTGDQLAREAEKMRLLKEESERENRYKEAQIGKLEREALAPADLGKLFNVEYLDENNNLVQKVISEPEVPTYLNKPDVRFYDISSKKESEGEVPLTQSVLDAKKEGLGEKGISKDTKINEDGSATILAGSPTAEKYRLAQLGFELDQDKFNLSKEQFKQVVRMNDLEEKVKNQEIAQSALDYEKSQFEFKVLQDREKRKNESIINSALTVSSKIDDILTTARNAGPENVFGTGASLFRLIPILGQQGAIGQVGNDLETFVAQLTKKAMDDFRALSSSGATGFGALNEKELSVLQSYIESISQAQDPKQIMQRLERLQNAMDAVAHGVIVDGKLEKYSPIKHESGLKNGVVLPATSKNSRLIGVPTAKKYPQLKGAKYLGQDTEGRFIFDSGKIDPINNKRIQYVVD